MTDRIAELITKGKAYASEVGPAYVPMLKDLLKRHRHNRHNRGASMTDRISQALDLLECLNSALEDFETNGEVETTVERTYLAQASRLLREELAVKPDSFSRTKEQYDSFNARVAFERGEQSVTRINGPLDSNRVKGTDDGKE